MTATTEERLDALITEVRALKQKSHVERIWDTALKALIPIMVVVIGWGIMLEVRVSVIESNRFTDRDATAMERRLKEGIPPKWLQDSILEIKERLRKLEERTK